MVRGRESSSATSVEIEAAFRVEHKIADTPPAPPPPPPRKNTCTPIMFVSFFSDVFSRCVYMDDYSSRGSDYSPTTFLVASFSLLF